MCKGLIFNIQKYSVHDGPGIRTTVFLKGCPLCCSWCHNPEGISPRPEVIFLENRCAGCGACRPACPFADSLQGQGPLPALNARCTACGECVEACPSGARQQAGCEVSVAELMDAVRKDLVFYEESGGGVTLSGGEPLMQPRFVRAVLEACRAGGLHTALDTCGFGCTDTLLELAGLARLVLYDLKFMDEARHREHCGVSNRPILENLRALDRVHPQIWLRVPVIPGVNDDEENLAAMAGLVGSLRAVRQVNLLPYHKTGQPKFRRLGQSYRLDHVQHPAPEQMRRATSFFRDVGIPVKTGG